MANRYLIGNDWQSTGSWSTSSGGTGGASIPTINDDVFLDANSPNIDLPGNAITSINDLDCSGYVNTLTFGTGIFPSGNLEVYGNCILSSGMTMISAPYDPDINHHADEGYINIWGQLDMSGTILDTLRFNLYGTRGTIQSVTATDIDSSHGKKMYAPGSTLTNCTNWTTDVYSVSTIHITNATQLQNISNDLTADYILDNDIDLTGVDWTPIGAGVGTFVGSFDGQGFTISNLTVSITKQQIDEVSGLFGFIGLYPGNIRAFISNLTLDNVDLTGIYALGGICGFMELGMILNCHVNNITIHGDPLNLGDGVQSAGGIGGDCFATGGTGLPSVVKDCTVDSFNIPGGLDCYLNYVGGLLGRGDDSLDGFFIENCSAINVDINTESGSQLVGGLVGGFNGTMNKCYAIGEMNFTLSADHLQNVGGLIGTHEGEITNCYAKVTINIPTTGDPFMDLIGGFSGSVGGSGGIGTILNCYSTGDITITAQPTGSQYDGIGGFIGKSTVNKINIIENCFSVGIVTVDSVDLGNYTVGGFIGYKNNSTITNCSWYALAYANAIGEPTQEWSNAKSYVIGDIVAVYPFFGPADATYYICTVNNSNKYPPNNLTKWSTTANPATSRNLDPLGLGTEEPDNTQFMTDTHHTVFAQGT